MVQDADLVTMED